MEFKEIIDLKYKGIATRYDINYWYYNAIESCKVSSFLFENEIDNVISFMASNKSNSLIIDTCGNYYQVDFSNFQYLPFVKELGLDSCYGKNVEYIYSLTDLEVLWLGDYFGEKIDLSRFKKLKKLVLFGNSSNVYGYENLKDLHTLVIHKYNYDNLKKLCCLEKLVALELVQPKCTSLEEIESLKELKCLTIYNASKLETLSGIENNKNLQYVLLHNCKKIQRLNYLENNKELSFIDILNCGTIDSLNFLNRLCKLDDVSFVDTNIVDGDVSPLIGIRIHNYSNKRNFNYKCISGIDIKK